MWWSFLWHLCEIFYCHHLWNLWKLIWWSFFEVLITCIYGFNHFKYLKGLRLEEKKLKSIWEEKWARWTEKLQSSKRRFTLRIWGICWERICKKEWGRDKSLSVMPKRSDNICAPAVPDNYLGIDCWVTSFTECLRLRECTEQSTSAFCITSHLLWNSPVKTVIYF